MNRVEMKVMESLLVKYPETLLVQLCEVCEDSHLLLTLEEANTRSLMLCASCEAKRLRGEKLYPVSLYGKQ